MIDKHSILLYIIIAFVIFMGLKIYSESDAFNLKCIISDVDGERYCVRERASMELAADLLANVTQKLKDLVAYCAKKFPDDIKWVKLKQNHRSDLVGKILEHEYGK
jgi:hypothetical protein